MPIKYTYLSVDILCVIFPLILSFHPKAKFYKEVKYVVIPCVATAAFFIAWDILFTFLQVWSFNPRYISGIYFFNLPVEELLFFICIPYACMFTYHLVKKFLRANRYNKQASIFAGVLSVLLTMMAVFNMHKLYTSVTFILLAVYFSILVFKRVTYIADFFLAFVFILIPFFVSNSILTGSFLSEPVVIYNNTQNLGIRIGTIPLEDIFYGMLLLLMNVSLYEISGRVKKKI